MESNSSRKSPAHATPSADSSGAPIPSTGGLPNTGLSDSGAGGSPANSEAFAALGPTENLSPVDKARALRAAAVLADSLTEELLALLLQSIAADDVGLAAELRRHLNSASRLRLELEEAAASQGTRTAIATSPRASLAPPKRSAGGLPELRISFGPLVYFCPHCNVSFGEDKAQAERHEAAHLGLDPNEVPDGRVTIRSVMVRAGDTDTEGSGSFIQAKYSGPVDENQRTHMKRAGTAIAWCGWRPPDARSSGLYLMHTAIGVDCRNCLDTFVANKVER